jgi:ribosome-associated translation inhibitor RaiA
MQLPVQIVFHQIDPWPGAEALLRAKAASLDRFAPDLMSCRIVVEEVQKHHRLGRSLAVRLDVRMPRQELSVRRHHDSDFHVAVREAFDAMARQIEDHARRRRGQVKQHGEPSARSDLDRAAAEASTAAGLAAVDAADEVPQP